MLRIANIRNFVGLAAMLAFTVGVQPRAVAQGNLTTWGVNWDSLVSETPSGSNFVAVDAGIYTSIALCADGSLVSWGNNIYGQVSLTPAGNNFVAASAGLRYCVALRADGRLVSWGYDDYGVVSGTPTSNNFVAVAAGEEHSVALRADGSIVSWGNNAYGQVSMTPTGNNFIAVSSGGRHSVALREDGSLVSWGNNSYGQVSLTPAGNSFVAVSAGGLHNVALRADGSLVSWGFDRDGQVSGTPTGTGFAAVSAGGYHNVALRQDGSLVSWGYASYGLISGTPTGNDFVAVSAGQFHTVAIWQSNSPPQANAGVDQIIEATGPMTIVALDGTGSSDPDNDALTYIWYEGTETLGTGSNLVTTLAPGEHIIRLVVTDPLAATSEDELLITVVDTTAPSIGTVQDVTVDESDPLGTPVSLSSPTVTDLVDPNPTLTHNAPALFSLGTTTVMWTARDASGNVHTVQQNVIVNLGSPTNQLDNLNELINQFVATGEVSSQATNSLLPKVEAAESALAQGNPNAAKVAMNDLKALVNYVEAQAGNQITAEAAALIIQRANWVIASLGG